MRYYRSLLRLFLWISIISTISCQKESESNFTIHKNKQTVVDHVLNLEGMYMIKYSFQYNDKYQVTRVFRGERYANASQMQLILESHYDSNNLTKFPDSISTYNTKGFKVGVIKPVQFNQIAELSKTQYVWPERENKLLRTSGGEFAMAIANSDVAWSGAGHLGSGEKVKIMDNLRLLNRVSLKDSIQIPVSYKTDGTKGNFDDFMIYYNNIGYPIKVSFYDAINTDFERLRINYREE